MSELKLEYLAPYSHYGLKCEILDYKSDYVGEQYLIMKGYYLMDDKPLFNFHNGRDFAGKNTTQFKPILRPLSDLTKDEFLNDLDWISKGAAKFLYESSKLPQNSDSLVLDGMYYKDIMVLIKNHFDVFGLIDKGLAIDINTLEK